MRELLYVSDRKLDQFAIAKRTGWLKRIGIEGEVGVPGLAKGNATYTPRTQADLEHRLNAVKSALDTSPRKPRPSTEAGLRPGDWVQFRASLNYCVLNEDNFGSVVFFVDEKAHGTTGMPTRRLLLHGSTEHLLGHPPMNVDVSSTLDHPRVVRVTGGTLPQLFYEIAGQLYRTDLRGDLQQAATKLLAVEGNAVSDVRGLSNVEKAAELVMYLLDSTLDNSTASLMAGYARVTFVADRINTLVASPLYVEYASPP
jgi:hypothetical protein